jgi:hypothetical protein
MSLWHPLQSFPRSPRGRCWSLVVSVALAVLLAAVLTWHGRPLDALTPKPFLPLFLRYDLEYDPRGIVAFEVAGTPEMTNKLIRAWGSTGVGVARRDLFIDFLFLVAYGMAGAALCVACAKAVPFTRPLGVTLAWAAWVAALADAVENFALLGILNAYPVPAGSNLPAVAQVAALTKFILLLFAAVYILLVAPFALFAVVKRLRPPAP